MKMIENTHNLLFSRLIKTISCTSKSYRHHKKILKFHPTTISSVHDDNDYPDRRGLNNKTHTDVDQLQKRKFVELRKFQNQLQFIPNNTTVHLD